MFASGRSHGASTPLLPGASLSSSSSSGCCWGRFGGIRGAHLPALLLLLFAVILVLQLVIVFRSTTDDDLGGSRHHQHTVLHCEAERHKGNFSAEEWARMLDNASQRKDVDADEDEVLTAVASRSHSEWCSALDTWTQRSSVACALSSIDVTSKTFVFTCARAQQYLPPPSRACEAVAADTPQVDKLIRDYTDMHRSYMSGSHAQPRFMLVTQLSGNLGNKATTLVGYLLIAIRLRRALVIYEYPNTVLTTYFQFPLPMSLSDVPEPYRGHMHRALESDYFMAHKPADLMWGLLSVMMMDVVIFFFHVSVVFVFLKNDVIC